MDFTSLLCIVGAMVMIIFVLGRFSSPGKKTASDTKPMDSNNIVLRKKKNWIPPIIIALILATWTVWGALFFLAVVWVLRKDPDEGSYLAVRNKEQKTARRVYTWLFLSPIFTIPIFIGMLFNLSYSSSTTNELVLTALVPLILHTPLLLGLTSKSIFVYRHSQQGILLIALRAGIASFAVSTGSYPDDGLWLFLLGNGALWLLGSLVGWSQVSSSKYWFMAPKGETVNPSTDEITALPAQKHIEQSKAFIQRYKSDEAKQHALAAFRSGDREAKVQAVKILKALGEVEKF